MAVTDKFRYRTDNPSADFPGLGENPALAPLNKQEIRAQLTFLSESSASDRKCAILAIVQRVTEYYEVIGYASPTLTKYSELPVVLCEWIVEPRYDPWRSKRHIFGDPKRDNMERLYATARYASLCSAVRIAVWEIEREVPESAKVLKYAGWAAEAAIKQFCGRRWDSVRGRLGTASMLKLIKFAIEGFKDLPYEIQGSNWNGKFDASNPALPS